MSVPFLLYSDADQHTEIIPKSLPLLFLPGPGGSFASLGFYLLKSAAIAGMADTIC
jgi:hypothetical protein